MWFAVTLLWGALVASPGVPSLGAPSGGNAQGAESALPSLNPLMNAVPKPGYPKPHWVSRAEWGAAPSDESRLTTHTIHWVTIHHGGVVYTGKPDPKTSLRNLQSWGSKEKHWGDVPYHFEIDLEGVTYECRPLKFSGDTNTEYNPRGHALVCVMGNYEEQHLSARQLDTLVEMCAWLCSEYGVPVGRIRGHKDWATTQCPGLNLYPYVADGTISRRVADRLAAKGLLTPVEGK